MRAHLTQCPPIFFLVWAVGMKASQAPPSRLVGFVDATTFPLPCDSLQSSVGFDPSTKMLGQGSGWVSLTANP